MKPSRFMMRINIKNNLLNTMYKLSKKQIENAPDFMPVVGYEGLYEVGKDGSVWSMNYRHTGERKQLRPAPCDKYGHLKVGLWKDGKMNARLVHQLVLNAYLPKPSPELVVMHLDSEPTNNRLENLVYGTCKENNNDEHRKVLVSEALTNHPDLSTPVLCIETGVMYPSVHEASRQTGIKQPSISACLNGRCKTAGGYHWEFLTDVKSEN